MILILLAVLAAVVLLYYKNSFTYWKSRGVPTLNPVFLLGDIAEPVFGLKNAATTVTEAYESFKARGHRFGGMYFFNKPILVITDTELLRYVLVKDFDHFYDRGMYCDPKNDPLSGHLFSLRGEEWKFIRHKTTPAFTSAKLKKMFGLIETHVDVLVDVIRNVTPDSELYGLFECVGIDIIGHVAFGLNCNTLRNENDEFKSMSKKIFKPRKRDLLKLIIKDGVSDPGNIVKLVTADKEMCKFFYNMVADVVKYRKENNIETNDFLQILIELMDKNDKTALTLDQVAAQSFVFFVAAFETSSKALNMCFYELGKNPEIQDKLREEINKMLDENEGKFTYDGIMNNTYLDCVLKETLRKYPPIVTIQRECIKAYKIPESDVIIEKGTIVMTPCLGLHYDPDNFENPNAFLPERFDETISVIKPYSFMAFGAGPRICIGERIGMLQVKLAIAKLTNRYKFSVSPLLKEPLILNPVTQSLILTFKDKILFNLEPV